MPQYMALLYDSPTGPGDISPEEIQAIIQKYKDWRDALAAKGNLVGGNKLRDGEGRILRRDGGGVRILDGPYAETKEVIGGYFALEASSYEEATKLLEDCPHLSYGGTISLRQIDEV